MTTIPLYSGVGASLSPLFTEGRTESGYVRMVADDGKALQKGTMTTDCIDVLIDDSSNWIEVDAPPEPEPEIISEEAFDIIFGGKS